MQVPPSTSRKAGSTDGLAGQAESPTQISKLLPLPTAHSVPMPAGSPGMAAITFGQHVQPLSPFPMGDSPALGSGYKAPQNTPAVGPALGLGSGRQITMTPSPYQAAESAGSARLLREEGAMVISVPAEAPGVQDLLAAFRRAAGQERTPPASPALAQPDPFESAVDSPANAASLAEQALSGTPKQREEQASGIGKAAWTDTHIQDRLVAGAEPETHRQAAAAAGAAHTLQDDHAVSVYSADGEAARGSEILSAQQAVAGHSSNSETVPVKGAVHAIVEPPQEAATTQATSSAMSHIEEAADCVTVSEGAGEALPQLQCPEACPQAESSAGALTSLAGAAVAAEEETAAGEPATPQETDSHELVPREGTALGKEQRRSPSKASRCTAHPSHTGAACTCVAQHLLCSIIPAF